MEQPNPDDRRRLVHELCQTSHEAYICIFISFNTLDGVKTSQHADGWCMNMALHRIDTKNCKSAFVRGGWIGEGFYSVCGKNTASGLVVTHAFACYLGRQRIE